MKCIFVTGTDSAHIYVKVIPAVFSVLYVFTHAHSKYFVFHQIFSFIVRLLRPMHKL